MGEIPKQKQRACLGVDISSTQVKLIELDGQPNAIRVASYASVYLPPNAVSDGQITNADTVGKAIARACKLSGTRNRSAAISVPGSAVISKTLLLPTGLSASEAEQQVMLEAPQHIPYPMENVRLDYQNQGPDPNSPDHNRILLVACRRDNVEIRTAVLDIAKLRPKLIDVDEYALRNACTLLHNQMPGKGHGATIAVFDIGAQKTHMCILHNRQTVYSREIDYGGQVMAEQLIKQHGLDGNEHLSKLLHAGQLQSDDIDSAMQDFCSELAEQVKSTLQFYFATEAESDHIDHILFTGGCTHYSGFEKHIRQLLERPAACANPLRGITASRKARDNHIEDDGPALMIATGLAMRSIIRRTTRQ